MSLEDHLRRHTQQMLANNPYATHLTHQMQPDPWIREKVNNEMDRIQADEVRKRSEQK